MNIGIIFKLIDKSFWIGKTFQNVLTNDANSIKCHISRTNGTYIKVKMCKVVLGLAISIRNSLKKVFFVFIHKIKSFLRRYISYNS